MTEYKKITDEQAPLYWDGMSNWVARNYAFLQQGYSFVNEAKNYIMIIFGAALTNKVATFFGFQIEPIWFLYAGIIGLPCLMVAGRWRLYRANKAVDFIINRHGSVTGYSSFNMQVDVVNMQVDVVNTLKEISRKLDKLK